MHAYIHAYIHACIHTYIHTYIHTFDSSSSMPRPCRVCVCVCSLICVYIFIYIHTYVCVCVCVCVCIYSLIYTQYTCIPAYRRGKLLRACVCGGAGDHSCHVGGECGAESNSGAQFTCFTSTKVQILTRCGGLHLVSICTFVCVLTHRLSLESSVCGTRQT